MNRTSLCIQMLQLLKSRGTLTTQDIAKALETNVRNIREYRKELELAGYHIESTTGKFGGYRLLSDCLLPSIQLSSEEKRALQEAQTYLSSHTDFIMGTQATRAIDKVLSNTPLEEHHTGFYLDNEQYVVSNTIKYYIELFETAIKEKTSIMLSYRSMKDQTPQRIQIHPYEIINYKGAYYCVAYSLKAKDFRIYKFSEERMKDCIQTDHHFHREAGFDIKQHIGKSGLVKNDIVEVELEIYGEAAILTAEKQIGLHPSHQWIDPQTLYYKTIFEGKQEALSFVMSLGAKATLRSPAFLKEEIRAQLLLLQQRYS